MTWETVIGLEIHVQLDTSSKMFCSCPTTFGDPPNTSVCPVCLGLPGALPVPNAHAVELGVAAALALDCVVHDESTFARKHYFYPDLPKGYQITQYDRPLASRGAISVTSPDRGRVGVGIERLHLEEDAGKSLHDAVPGRSGVDFNRCGIPLAEIVTAPDLRSPAEARALLTALKQTLQYAGVSACSMEEGSLRVDANCSVRRLGEPRGTKQEVKNLNSFAGVERALDELSTAQRAACVAGQAVEPATFSAAGGGLRRLRGKEERHDYRYFPEPDLPDLALGRCGIDVEAIRSSLPESAAARRARFVKTYGASADEAAVLTATRELADYFEAVVAAGADQALAARWVMGPVLADAATHQGALRVPEERVAALLQLVAADIVSLQAAKRVFPELATASDPRAVAEQLGLIQERDTGRIASWVQETLREHPAAVARHRGGETKILAFLTGQVMKRSGGRADPKRVGELLKRQLDEDDDRRR